MDVVKDGNSKSPGECCAAITPPVAAAPIEIPQLYSQMGRFDTKINGKPARVGITMIPPVSFSHR